MTKVSSSIERPKARRQQIIDVAADLFAERGYHGVSITDIGSALGLSGPALYKHFASKDALLAEMLVGISERLLSEGEQRYRATVEHGPDATLSALVGWHIEFALNYPSLITVQFRDLANLNDTDRNKVRRLQRRYVERWVGVIVSAVPTDEDHARAAAHAVFALINSTPHSARLDREQMAALLHRMALAAIHSSGDPAPPGPRRTAVPPGETNDR
ncbi:TetR/AcrR family transcriptional regulator [Flexivirga oryzae]|uniref:AcrR family transcriptional regulator n=1 Tax=Flexivirga oryzae TaxID=1794944 RepID=A0A839N8P2_9MICO|nr:TetR/AcrR family transcriptional regulator [Flexivirga oryzae]MBB2891996.1 AcrR family transcriptional regulator [Flexivirga oryzae]